MMNQQLRMVLFITEKLLAFLGVQKKKSEK